MNRFFILMVLTCLLLLNIGVSKTFAAEFQLIIINKSNNQLAYYENSKLKKTFTVATGRQASYTPEGKFKVVNKIVNRPYYKEKIPGGDPRNPLGNRWIGLNARGTWGDTYAIHGNNNPSSIGKYVSSGCIRMYDEEVEWLFKQVKVNTPVIITSSGKAFNSIASANGYKVSGNIKSPSQPVNSNVILKKGSRGNDVKELQRRLTSLGYNTYGADGVFGSNTEKAVRKFQKDRKLTVDGKVGPLTKKSLGKF